MYWKILAALALAVLLPGCADMVPIKVTKPPQLDLGAVRKLKLENFAVKGREHGASSAELSVDSIMGHLLLDAPTAQEGVPLWEAQRSGLAQALADNGYMQVSEGPDQEATLSGAIGYSVGDNVSESERYNEFTKKNEEVYTLTRSAEVTLDFAVTGADGRVLAKSRVQTSAAQSWQDTSEYSVRRTAGSDAKPVVLEALDRANSRLVCMLAPCTVVVNHELRSGSSADMGKGNKAARHGEWDAAAALWQKSLEAAPPLPLPADRLAALHNLGVYFEVKGDLQQALDRYQQVYAGSGKPDDKAEVDRVTQAIRDDARLRQLLQAKDAGKDAAPPRKLGR